MLRTRALLRTPAVAVILSFLFPGLGLIAAGRYRRGLSVAIPALAITAVAVGVLLFDRRALAGSLFSDRAMTSFLLLDVVLLVYRLWAIVDTYRLVVPVGAPPEADSRPSSESTTRRRKPSFNRGIDAAILVAVIVATTGTHAALGAVDIQYRDALTCVFNPDAPCWFGNGNLAAGETAPPVQEDETPAIDEPTASPGVDTPSPSLSPSPAPGSPAATAPPSPTPRVTAGPITASGIPIFPVEDVSGPNTSPLQWADDGFLNVLLVGADQGVGRWSLRPDTMILLQVELATGRAVMYGIPRNLENVPLPPEAANAFACHCFPYPNLLNELWRDAVNRPKAYPYPGSDFVRGFKALEGAIGQYLGLHVDGAVVINLMGFVHLIDALGGLDIYVPKELKDSQYSRPQDGKDVRIDIKAGQQHMNGYTALAYARSRHQDSDYGRMARQQAVLLALRAQLHPCELLPKVPDLISALGSAFWTDMPIADASILARLAERVGTGNVKSIELVPSVTGNPVGFLTVPRWATVRWIVAHGLDGVPPSSPGGNGGSGAGGFSC
jgi:LCP family protein required for cell wall assembly